MRTTRIPFLDEKTKKDIDYIREVDYKIDTSYRRGKKGFSLFCAWLKKNKMWIQILLFYIFMLFIIFITSYGSENGDDLFEEDQSKDEILGMGMLIIIMPIFMIQLGWPSLVKNPLIKQIGVAPIERRSIVIYKIVDTMKCGFKLHFLIFILVLQILLIGFTILESLNYAFRIFIALFLLNGCLKEGINLCSNYIPKRKAIYFFKKTIAPLLFTLIMLLMIFFFCSLIIFDKESIKYFIKLPLVWVIAGPLLLPIIAIIDYQGILISISIIIGMGFVYLILLNLSYNVERKNIEVGYKLPKYLSDYFIKRHKLIKSTKRDGKDKTQYLFSNFEFKKGVRTFDSMRELKLLKNPKNRVSIPMIIIVLGFSIFFYFMLPIVGLLFLVGMLFMGYSINSPNFYNQKILRLVPEEPEKIVEFFIKEVNMRFLKSYYQFMIPFAIFISLPISIPTLGQIEPPDFDYYLSIFIFLPVLLLSALFLGYSKRIFNIDKTNAKNLIDRIIIISVTLLFVIYGGLILRSIEFHNLGIILSFILHLLIVSGLYFFTITTAVQNATNYLYNNRLYKSKHFFSVIKKMDLKSKKAEFCKDKVKLKGLQEYIKGINKNHIFALGISIILILIFIPNGKLPEVGSMFSEGYRKGPIPYNNAIYYENEILEDLKSNPETNIIINSTVTLKNTTIEFQNDEDGIYILKKGNLKIINSTVSSRGYFKFEVYGSLFIEKSKISRLWGDKKYIDYDGGIEIYKDGSVIKDTVIYDCETNGIMAGRAKIIVKNTTFFDIKDDPIELRRSDSKIINCTIYNSSFAIFMSRSDPLIENTTIFDVDNNPIKYESDSDPILINNTLEWNPKTFEDYISPIWFQIIILIIVASVDIKVYIWIKNNFNLKSLKYVENNDKIQKVNINSKNQ